MVYKRCGYVHMDLNPEVGNATRNGGERISSASIKVN